MLRVGGRSGQVDVAVFGQGRGLATGPHTSAGVCPGHRPAVRVFAYSVDFCKQTLGLTRGCPLARASRPKAAAGMQPRAFAGAPVERVSLLKREMLPRLGDRVNLGGRSPGASALAPGKSGSLAQGCPLAAWQTVLTRASPANALWPFFPPGDSPRIGGRAGQPGMRVPRVPRVCPGSCGQLGLAGGSDKLLLAPERRGPERVWGRLNHAFHLHHLHLYISGGGLGSMRAAAVPPVR